MSKGKDDTKINELARLARDGDGRAMEKLLSQFKGIAIGYVRHLNVPDCDAADDLVQEGLMGIAKAISTYDPDRGAKVFTWCFWLCRSAIQQAWRRYRKDWAVFNDSEAMFAVPCREPDPGPPNGICAVLAELNEEERALVSAIYGLGGAEPATLAVAAERLGMSHKKATAMQRQAKERLRAAFPLGVSA